jgi:hypothetical protein
MSTSARGQRAAEGRCPVGQDTVDTAAPLAKTAHALAELSTFLASGSLEHRTAVTTRAARPERPRATCCQQKAAAPKTN